ncbi:MAG: hypothetical protein IKP71_12320 [Candidatus Riflebacteria bacterium]|nr:hypothetical protein [Candidatus Riflebacteria bacterium]
MGYIRVSVNNNTVDDLVWEYLPKVKDQTSPEYLYYTGCMFLSIKDLKTAEKNFNSIPESDSCYYHLIAEKLFESNFLTPAIEYYSKSITIESTIPEYYERLGWVYHQRNNKGDLEKAIQNYNIATKLDPEYLCIYLPQLLQDKNTKVRLTATRAFQSIDSESVINMVLSLLKSLNVKQRTIGITTAMLVDFNMVRDAYLMAFSKETSEDLLEKIGLVLAANPDRELVKDLYFAHKSSKTLLKAQREKIIEMVSEKVSFSLGGSPWPKELVIEAQDIYEAAQKEGVSSPSVIEVESEKTSSPAVKKPTSLYNSAKVVKTNISKFATINTNKDQPEESFLEKSGWSALNTKAKMTIIILLLGAVFWGILIVVVVMRVLFGA